MKTCLNILKMKRLINLKISNCRFKILQKECNYFQWKTVSFSLKMIKYLKVNINSWFYYCSCEE